MVKGGGITKRTLRVLKCMAFTVLRGMKERGDKRNAFRYLVSGGRGGGAGSPWKVHFCSKGSPFGGVRAHVTYPILGIVLHCHYSNYK